MRRAAGRGEQEVARAAGGVDDAHRQDRVRPPAAGVEDGVERGVEQRLHQSVGRVVRAGRVARVALRLGALAERQRSAAAGKTWDEFQKALIDRAKLFGLHVAPVDPVARDGFGVRDPGHAEQCLVPERVADGGGVEGRRAPGREEPAERRQCQPFLPVRKRPEDDLRRLETVVMAVPCGAQASALGSTAHGLAVRVVPCRSLVDARRMKQAAILGRQHEDDAVDEAQELGDESIDRDLAVRDLRAHRGIG